MPGYALSSLIFALVAAILGFGGIPGLSAWMAIGLFALLMGLFIFSLLAPPNYSIRSRSGHNFSRRTQSYQLSQV